MNCFQLWRKWILPLVFSIYIILALIAIPLCVWELERKDAPDHVVAWFVGGLFTIVAVPISLWGIFNHLINYTQPYLQRYIIRILWMVPIYGMNAWFALRFPDAAIYLDTLRECYEAYVIYNFMSYLLSYLWSEHPNFDVVLEGKPQQKHLIPFCYCPVWPMGETLIQRCKHGVLQYTVVRPATTVIALACEIGGKYGEGDFNFTTAWSYLVLVNNISQIWAMYNLILFYKATKDELKPIKPVPKFLCVKFVVFMSFWQSVVIAALVKLNVIPQNGTWDFYHSTKEVATGLQDFLICIEMFFASIAHYYSFTYKPFINTEADRGNCCETFLSMWDVTDVRNDFIEHVQVIGKTVKGKVTRKSNRSEERTPLLSDDSSQSLSIHHTEGYSSSATHPPVGNNEVDFHVSTKPDNHSLSADWDASSLDRQESYSNKSQTASLVNYAEFDSSLEKVSNDTSENIKVDAKANTQLAQPEHIPGDTESQVLTGDVKLDNPNSESSSEAADISQSDKSLIV